MRVRTQRESAGDRRERPEPRRGGRSSLGSALGAWLPIASCISLGALIVAGCEPVEVPPLPRPPPAAASADPDRARPIARREDLPLPTADPARREERVQEACVRCHLLPPADALPREAWGAQILVMTTLEAPADVEPLTPSEAADAIAWYEEHAPAEWIASPPPAAPDPPAYRRADFTPAGLEGERIPAVSFLAFAPADDPGGPALIAAEMRSRTLLRLPRSARAPTDLGLESPGWNYPAHIAHGDLDGDGRLDRIVAGLGGMNPTREERGGVQIRLAAGGGIAAVGPMLARVSGAQAGDLDGDGDLDLVAAAFGWRREGRLIWLEQGAPLSFRLRTIDERDGFVHAIPADLDGDGDLDLAAVLAQEFEETIFFRNEGAGRFVPIVLHKAPHPGWGTSGLELADLDGDRDLDLLVSHGDTLDVAVVKLYHGVAWLENRTEGGTPLFVHREIGMLPGCARAVAGDADGDGDLDVAAVAFLPQIDPAEWRRHDVDSVVLFERDGDGWRRHAIEKGDPLHAAVAIGDVDGDGDADIAVGNYVWIDEGGEPRQRREYLTVYYRE